MTCETVLSLQNQDLCTCHCEIVKKGNILCTLRTCNNLTAMNGTVALLQLVDLLVEFKYNEAPYSFSLSLSLSLSL